MSKTKHKLIDIFGYRLGQALRRLNVPSLFIGKVFHLWFLVTNAMTIGVRIAAFDDQGRVFLVRHTYIEGWHLPGGGMERNETTLEAMQKELMEEGNLVATDQPTLFSIYMNRKLSPRNHVVLYKCRAHQTEPKKEDSEISGSGFFSFDQLPEGTTDAVRSRLSELQGDKEVSRYWG